MAALATAALTGCSSPIPKPTRSPSPSAPSPVPRVTAAAASTAARPGKLAQRAEPSLPQPVQETAAAVVGSRLYVIGGYDAAGASTVNVFVFDGSRWTTGPALPEAVNHPAAATLGTTLYVAGGFVSGGASNGVFALPEGATAWRTLKAMRHARGALVLLAAGGRLVAAGGNNGSTQVASTEAYDPATDSWSELAPLPHPRNHAAGFLDTAGDVCLAGGREPATSAAVDCLSPSGDWAEEASLPTPTSGAAAAVIGATTAVAGGEPAGETALTPVIQELANGAWGTTPMLVPRHGTGYVGYEGRLWMCGGATAPGVHAVATCTSLGP